MVINSTSTPSRTSFLFNKVGLFDEYIAFKESNTVDSILVGDFDGSSFTGTKYSVTQQNNVGYALYTISQKDYINEPITIQNEYYVYSNIGLGQQGQIYQHQQILSGVQVMFFGVVLGYMILKGVGGVWRWFRSRR